MNQQNIGKFISQKRKEKNLTQEQLAEKLAVSNKTVSKWETGKCMPDYSIIEMLCKELGITMTELMDGEEHEKSIRVYDEEQILDFLQKTQNLEKQKGLLISVLYVSISGSICEFAEHINGSVVADVISILVNITAVVLAFYGLWNALKCLKSLKGNNHE